ncbi:hypothetical protein A3Q56_07647 [Intoshia linei]|uniref:DNA-directed RNA polymerase n=1 Tax=Intoshia linei TaxID=1819745 RepID=A0A177ATT5_9BILA|nr:hypothetical protein A3Q56_07647 [Intoshia linei]
MHSSDRYKLQVCHKCGLIAHNKWCKSCNSTNDVSTIDIPYASKLLIQELISMNVLPRLSFKTIL